MLYGWQFLKMNDLGMLSNTELVLFLLNWQAFAAKHGCFFWSTWEIVCLVILSILIFFIIFLINSYNHVIYSIGLIPLILVVILYFIHIFFLGADLFVIYLSPHYTDGIVLRYYLFIESN